MDEVAEKFADYAVELRYPDTFYIPTLGETLEVFEIIDKVKEFIFRKLGIQDQDLNNRGRK